MIDAGPYFFYQKDIIAENFVGKKKDPPVAPFYPPVNKHNYGKSQIFIGKTTINGHFH